MIGAVWCLWDTDSPSEPKEWERTEITEGFSSCKSDDRQRSQRGISGQAAMSSPILNNYRATRGRPALMQRYKL